MFAQLLEEVKSVLPFTPAQNARVQRAVAEGDRYRYETASDIYNEPAVWVTTLSGSRYLVFADACTCQDWTNRGPLGTDEIQMCKHCVAAHANGELVEPLETPADYSEPFQDAPGTVFPTQPAQPGWDWAPNLDELPEGEEEPDLPAGWDPAPYRAALVA